MQSKRYTSSTFQIVFIITKKFWRKMIRFQWKMFNNEKTDETNTREIVTTFIYIKKKETRVKHNLFANAVQSCTGKIINVFNNKNKQIGVYEYSRSSANERRLGKKRSRLNSIRRMKFVSGNWIFERPKTVLPDKATISNRCCPVSSFLIRLSIWPRSRS